MGMGRDLLQMNPESFKESTYSPFLLGNFTYEPRKGLNPYNSVQNP
jgi:hypothetical protein